MPKVSLRTSASRQGGIHIWNAPSTPLTKTLYALPSYTIWNLLHSHTCPPKFLTLWMHLLCGLPCSSHKLVHYHSLHHPTMIHSFYVVIVLVLLTPASSLILSLLNLSFSLLTLRLQLFLIFHIHFTCIHQSQNYRTLSFTKLWLP